VDWTALDPFTVLESPSGYPVPLPGVLGKVLPELVLPEGDRPGVANFVSTLDGAVFLSDAEPLSKTVALGSAHDWWLLAVLRQIAPTFIASAAAVRNMAHKTQAGHDALPALKGPLMELREELGLGPAHHVVASATGDLPAACGTWDAGPATVVTTERAAERLALPAHVRVVVAPATDHGVSARSLVEVARAVTPDRTPSGAPAVVVSEPGPRLFARFLREQAMEWLYLTMSPLLAGQATGRLDLVAGQGRGVGTLDGLLRAGSHLFMRYRLAPYTPPTPS